MGENKLTEEQRKLITDNHNLIYGYMHDRHIDMEYYGDFAEKFCLAIPQYDNSKAQLTTFIYNVFDNHWKHMLKYKYSQCRHIPKEKQVFLDAVVSTGGDKGHSQTMQDILGFDDDGYNSVDEGDLIGRLRKELKARYPQDETTDGVIEYILKGYNCREVGDVYGVSRQSINARVEKIRKIYEKIKEREECK